MAAPASPPTPAGIADSMPRESAEDLVHRGQELRDCYHRLFEVEKEMLDNDLQPYSPQFLSNRPFLCPYRLRLNVLGATFSAGFDDEQHRHKCVRASFSSWSSVVLTCLVRPVPALHCRYPDELRAPAAMTSDAAVDIKLDTDRYSVLEQYTEQESIIQPVQTLVRLPSGEVDNVQSPGNDLRVTLMVVKERDKGGLRELVSPVNVIVDGSVCETETFEPLIGAPFDLPKQNPDGTYNSVKASFEWDSGRKKEEYALDAPEYDARTSIHWTAFLCHFIDKFINDLYSQRSTRLSLSYQDAVNEVLRIREKHSKSCAKFKDPATEQALVEDRDRRKQFYQDNVTRVDTNPTDTAARYYWAMYGYNAKEPRPLFKNSIAKAKAHQDPVVFFANLLGKTATIFAHKSDTVQRLLWIVRRKYGPADYVIYGGSLDECELSAEHV